VEQGSIEKMLDKRYGDGAVMQVGNSGSQSNKRVLFNARLSQRPRVQLESIPDELTEANLKTFTGNRFGKQIHGTHSTDRGDSTRACGSRSQATAMSQF